MSENDQNLSNTPTPEWKSPRTYLAVGIPLVCIVCIFTISIMLIKSASNDKVFAAGKEILNLLLPLTGTWVGTILAFYFSRDNFVAANQSVKELAAKVSASTGSSVSTLAKDKMIPFQKIEHIADKPDPDLVAEVRKLTAGDRLPIFDATNAALYVLHRSTIDRFAVDKGTTSVLLSTLLADPQMKAAAESFGLCPETATLGQVKDTMYRIPDCQDVFLTKTGKQGEPVIGWVTNGILQDNLIV